MKVKPATYSSHTLLATTTQPSSKTGRPNFLSFSIRYYSKVKGKKCFKTQSITFFFNLALAREQQTHCRSSLLFSEGEKRRPEMRLLFAGYRLLSSGN